MKGVFSSNSGEKIEKGQVLILQKKHFRSFPNKIISKSAKYIMEMPMALIGN